MTPSPQKSKKQSTPWYLKPYNPTDPLDIPMNLRRALETPSQAAARKAAWDEVHSKERKRLEAEKRRQEAAREQAKAEALSRNKRKLEAHNKREARKAKRAAKQASAVSVLNAIEAGADTKQQIQKATGLDKALTRVGLRILLKSGKVVKVEGTRRYKSAWAKSSLPPKSPPTATPTPQPRLRLRLPKP